MDRIRKNGKEAAVSSVYYDDGNAIEYIGTMTGMSLSNILKVLEYGLFYKSGGEIRHMVPTKSTEFAACRDGIWELYLGEGMTIYDYKDYGKTWALTEEELKKNG